MTGVTDRSDARLARACVLSGPLGAVLADLPLWQARAFLRGLAASVDDVRAALGVPFGLHDAYAVPATPDFLKDRDDWIADLKAAWRALSVEDRAAFLRAVQNRTGADR